MKFVPGSCACFAQTQPRSGSSGFEIDAEFDGATPDLLPFKFDFCMIHLCFIVHVDRVLYRENRVEKIAVEHGAVLRDFLRRFSRDQTFIAQAVHVLLYRASGFTDRFSDGGITREALKGFSVLAVQKIRIGGDFLRGQSEMKHLVRQRKEVSG